MDHFCIHLMWKILQLKSIMIFH